MIPVLTTVRDLVRLREITSVLVRHGFGEIVMRARFGRKKGAESSASIPPDVPELSEEDAAKGEESKKRISTAERIRLVLQDLGPTFIKLGQIASTRTDLLPVDVITELKKLQDDVPSVPFADLKRSIEESLGAPIDQVFLSFDETPLATASIGQVHRARIQTEDGVRELAVKVQRPGVATTVARDLELLHMMAAAIERAIPETKIYSPVGLVRQFDRSITAELDFALEGENAERFARNFEENAHIRFPKIYKQASSKHVLAIEFFDGRKLDVALNQGLNGPLVAERAVSLVVKMIFEDGFFHADPHPGNIILLGDNSDPVIGLIDLGMVGRLSPELRDRTIDIMVAAVRKDSYAVADAVYAIGRPTRKVDMREFRAETAVLAEKYIGKALKDIELSSMIRDLVRTALKYGIEIPTDFMLVGKALMTLEGIGRQLDPEIDIMKVASPIFLDLLRQRYSPERLGNDLWRGMEQLSRAGYDMPMQVREVLDDLRLGRLTLRVEDSPLAKANDRLGKRAAGAMVFAPLTLAGAYLLAHDKWIAAAVFLVLAITVWARELVRR